MRTGLNVLKAAGRILTQEEHPKIIYRCISCQKNEQAERKTRLCKECRDEQ